MPATTLSAKEFIYAWQNSDSIKEVCKRTGLKDGTVRTRAYNYRNKGIPLKQLTSGSTRDWDELASYAKEVLDAED
jgi:hypothetical protein